MDKRTIIAVVLSVAILFAWQYWFSPKPGEQQKPQAATAQGQTQATAPSQPQAAAPGQQAAPQVPAIPGQPAIPGAAAPKSTALMRPAKKITVETPIMTVKLTDIGGGITSVRLKAYKEELDKPEGKEVIQGIEPYRYLPTVSTIIGGQVEGDAVPFTADRGDFTVSGKPEAISFKGTLASGAVITKTYTFSPDGYNVGLSVRTDWGRRAGTTLLDFVTMSMKQKSSYIFRGPFLYDGKKFEQIDKPDKATNAGQAYSYTGFDEGYFSFIIRPVGQKADLLVTKVGDTPIDRLLSPGGNVAASLYFVPNKISLLKGLDFNADKIVDFGWFDIVAKPMLWGMNFSNKLTHNYGIDIILLTILIKIIFYPLSLKSYKSMKNMQKLQPKLAALREKYKNDKERLNQEMMGIYKTRGHQPSGRLPAHGHSDTGLLRPVQGADDCHRVPPRAVHALDERPGGAGEHLHHARGRVCAALQGAASYHGRHHGYPAEDDADRRRPDAGEDDDVHAYILHLPVLGVPGGPRPVLARK